MFILAPTFMFIIRSDEGGSIANMIVEVPRWSHAKLELSLKEVLNPIHHVCICYVFLENENNTFHHLSGR